MEKDHEQRHLCKFCNKSFPCGRSLGGHMRSHLITISPPDHPKNEEKIPKKKLPPLGSKPDLSMDQLGYGLRENPKKASKLKKPRDEDASLQEKACKECGKTFQSWKALFGHMKCHSVNCNGRINATITNSLEEDSSNSCHDHHKTIMDSQSDNEAATPLCRRKRSDRMKRYTPTSTRNSSSLTQPEIDHHEQEEVALSLIILSRDKGDWNAFNSVVESSDHSPDLSQAKKNSKKLKSVSRNEAKTRKLDALNDEVLLQIEFEVNSPRNLIKVSDQHQKKSNARKRKPDDDDSLLEKSSKFSCSICKKAFQSYQALGGHRASHKKFNGCCAPRSENSLETESSHNQSEAELGCKKSKDHECPICFKVFPSGQALGGHKRSHVINANANANANALPAEAEKPTPIRDFLDLNLPAPDEEECNEFKPWWIVAGSGQQRPLLGLLSS